MTTVPTEMIAAGCFGVSFVIAMVVLAIKFPKPTPFQYTTFRIVLAIAVAGIAPFIPGLLEVTVSTLVKAGGAIGVFVIVYFFSPAKLVAISQNPIDLPALLKAWEGIQAPNIHDMDKDMAHRALNALSLVAWYWEYASQTEKRLIKDESFAPFEQWFSVLDTNQIQMTDGKSSKEHLDGKIRTTYQEMKSYG